MKTLLRILEILNAVIAVLLYLCVVYISVAIWWTGHPFVTKLLITAHCILVSAIGLYIGIVIYGGK